MADLGILYLDKHKDRAFHKVLCKYGSVYFADDINEALFLMAEHEFDFYFIDADAPQSLAFIKHLRHDPQLMQPRGVVLLTENEEEDCEAWVVDDFLTRRTAINDLPYIFSHLRGEPVEPVHVLRIAATEVVFNEPEPARRSCGESVSGDEADDELDIRDIIKKNTSEKHKAQIAQSAGGTITTSSRPRAARLAIVTLIAIAVVAWLFVWGPLNSRSPKPTGNTSSSQRGVHASSSTRTGSRRQTAPAGYTSQTTPAAAQAQTSPAPIGNASTVQADAVNTPVQIETPPANATPAPPPVRVNHAPSVSVSGPSQVLHGEPAEFAASASDPDGDEVSLSWTSKTMCWSAPGLYSLSVSGTDNRGASSSDTLMVRVI